MSNHQYNISIPNFPSSQLILHSITNFSKRHKLLTTSYIAGLLFLLLVGNGFHVSQQQYRHYNRILSTIDLNQEYDASQNVHRSYQAYTASKGWFRCDSLCQRHKQRYEHHKRVLHDIRNEGYAKMSHAKSMVGLFSTIGIQETKDLFWDYFHSGLKFAKRQSMWDLMFFSLRSMSRDESFLEYALKIGFQVFINLSMGLAMCLGVFVLGLWSVVKSYQSNPFIALCFYMGASCAAFSFVVTCWIILMGVAMGGVVGLGKVVSQRGRLGGGGRYGGYSNYNRVGGQTPRPHHY